MKRVDSLSGEIVDLARAMIRIPSENPPGDESEISSFVSERLRSLGSERQVLCITHLPQVASLAGTHFRIEKRIEGGETTATVERVDGDELVAEIVRMMGADRDDATASRHAKDLLKAA